VALLQEAAASFYPCSHHLLTPVCIVCAKPLVSLFLSRVSYFLNPCMFVVCLKQNYND
jgi:hypothetical protein